MHPMILKINLSDLAYEAEEIPNAVMRKYIGGRGLGAFLLYQSVPAKTDPLCEENHLIFTAGPAHGSGLFYSSKVNVATKSPLTNIYLYSIASGSLGHQMKRAGFWAIDIQGKAERPTSLVIENGSVKFEDASSLWGKEPAQTQRLLLEKCKRSETATVAIGPAAEKLVPYASIFSEGPLYRCFGRGGAGSVMGSKNLKAIAVKGNKVAEIEKNKEFLMLQKESTRLLKTEFSGWAKKWRRYETAADLEVMNEFGILPTRNWQYGQFESWREIDKSTSPVGWPHKGRACGPFCPTPGCREVEIKEGPYQGVRSDVEWETIYAFGSNCGIDKMEAIIAASQICDEFGIDTMTAGVTIGFAMECFEKGLIGTRETDGIRLRFGDDRAMIRALQKIVQLEGFGKQLAKGTRQLSEEIKGSEAFAMQAKGMEFGGYECRGLNGQALQFAVNCRGGCHHGYGLPARQEIFDNSNLNVVGKGEQLKLAAINRIVRDSIIVCTFTPIYNNKMMAEVLSVLLKENWSVDDIEAAGTRIMCQERLFNMREGLTRADDILPDRLLKEPKTEGATKNAVVPLEALKDDFYKAMGYSISSGNPTDELLSKLGIQK